MNASRIIRHSLSLFLFAPGLAMAASILVNTNDDELNNDGDCSLREAIASANGNTSFDACSAGEPDTDTILLVIKSEMTLNMGELEVTEALEIQGFFDDLTIKAASSSRHFVINMPDNTHDFSISFVTLSRGDAPDAGGGSILAEQVGTLTLDSVNLSQNQATSNDVIGGGAIALLLPANNGSRLEIVDSVFENNTSGLDGGAVFIAGLDGSNNVESVDIRRSRFFRNTARGSGGAVSAVSVQDLTISQSVYEVNTASLTQPGSEIRQSGGAVDWQASGAVSPTLLIKESTFHDNFARQSGGAVTAIGGDSVFINSTFHRNTVGSDGGQALLLSSGDHELLFNTLTDNNRQTIADFTIRAAESASVEMGHNIVWTDSGIAVMCRTFSGASFTSVGYNVVKDDSCAPVQTDQVGVDPGLGIFGDYGGPALAFVMKTRLPVPGSAAIDGGNVSCPGPGGGARGASTSVDQRGRPRPQTGPARGASPLCDIGAVEYQPGSERVDGIFADRFKDIP